MTERFFSRDLLAKHFGGDHRMIAEFEASAEATKGNTASVADTVAMRDATVLVLSANGEFTNEFQLVVGDGLGFDIEPGAFTLWVDVIGRGIVTLSRTETLSNKTLDAPSFTGLGNYANDAAAATGGVPIGGAYRNGSVMMVRVT